MARKPSTTVAAMPDGMELDRIAGTVFTTMLPAIRAAQAATEAGAAQQSASAAHNSAREDCLVNLARLAHARQWPEAVVNAAVALALKRGNSATPKAIESITGDMKSAMHPAVREYVPTMRAVRDEAWAREAWRKGEGPLAKAFKRRYHVFRAMMAACRHNRFFYCADELIAFAIEHDPDLNLKKQYEVVQDMIATLSRVDAYFPCDGVKMAMACLSNVLSKRQLPAVPRARTKPATVVAHPPARHPVAA